jgi:AhpD family alkylhydroperoxidase
MDYAKASPDAFKAMLALESFVRNSGLNKILLELVKIRVSQINQCAYCLDMHTKDARAAGETEQRIYALSAWRETPFFSNPERAALGWAEAVTLVSTSQVPDEAFVFVHSHFSEVEIVNLTMAINAINSWNRLAISFRMIPGDYRPPTRSK